MRWSLLVFVFAAAFFSVPGIGRAHLGSTAYVEVEGTDDGAVLTGDLDAIDAAMELGLTEDADWATLSPHAPAIRSWVSGGWTLQRGGQPCAGQVAGPTRTERNDTPYLRFEVTFRCEAEGALAFGDALVFPDDGQHETYVRLIPGGETHILRRGRQEVTLGESDALGTLGVFLWEGVLHFVTGYDHVLFLFSLIFAAGFVLRRRGKKAALKDVLALVTAFTVGHSVTLIAAALGWVVLPIQPVEIAIAASIVVVAAVNLWRPEERRAMPAIALGFGLIHGFGFSAVLGELGLPRQFAVGALLAFNVGIEVAQLVAAALVFALFGSLARWERYPQVVRGGSALIALVALYWVVERI